MIKALTVLTSIIIGSIFIYKPDTNKEGIVSIESNLGDYRVIPDDKGGINDACIELNLDICNAFD